MKFLFVVLKILIWVLNLSILGNMLLDLERIGIYLGTFYKVYLYAGMSFFAIIECKLLNRRKKKDED